MERTLINKMRKIKIRNLILKKETDGMVTIEACFIIPIVLMITMLIIWMGFFFYNQNVLTQSAGIAVIYGSRMAEKSNEEIVDAVRNRLTELLDGKIIGMELSEICVSVDYGEIKVEMEGSMQIPGVLFLSDIYQNHAWNLKASQSAERLRCSMVTRTIGIMENR